MTATRKFLFLITPLAVLFSMTACDLTDSGLEDDNLTDTPTSVEFATVETAVITIDQSANGSYAYSEKTQLVIGNEEEFASFWELLHSNIDPKPDLPEVDFSEYTVLAVMMGIQPTSGFSISVTDITQENGTISVEIEETEPGMGCVNTQVLTAPYHVVKMSNVSDADFSFNTDRKTVTC
jgi:hypothetical protein